MVSGESANGDVSKWHGHRSAACGGYSEANVAQRSKKASTYGCAGFFGNRKRA